MKSRYLLLAMLALLAVAGCQTDKGRMQDIYANMRVDADNAVYRCEELKSEENKQICYGTYLTIKADRDQGIEDAAICDKVNPDIKEGCLQMLKAKFMDIVAEMQENPDAAVARCDELTEDVETCYGTYLTIKADRGEGITDPSICEKVEASIREGCILMVQ